MTTVATLFQASQGAARDDQSWSTQVYDRLRTDLMSGDLKPDQRLKIRELAAKMAVRRRTARYARPLPNLSWGGMVLSRSNPRYFVRVRRL